MCRNKRRRGSRREREKTWEEIRSEGQSDKVGLLIGLSVICYCCRESDRTPGPTASASCLDSHPTFLKIENTQRWGCGGVSVFVFGGSYKSLIVSFPPKILPPSLSCLCSITSPSPCPVSLRSGHPPLRSGKREKKYEMLLQRKDITDIRGALVSGENELKAFVSRIMKYDECWRYLWQADKMLQLNEIPLLVVWIIKSEWNTLIKYFVAV